MATHKFFVTGSPPWKKIIFVDMLETEESRPMDALLRQKIGFNQIIPFVLIYKGKVYETTLSLQEFATRVKEKGFSYSPGLDMVTIHTSVGNLFATDEEIRAEDMALAAFGYSNYPEHETHPIVKEVLQLVRVTPSGEKYLDEEGVALLSSTFQECFATPYAKRAIIDLINLAGLLREQDGERVAEAIIRVIMLANSSLGSK